MNLPFTHDQFLDVFGGYNTALWSVVAGVWLLSAVAVLRLFSRGRLGGRSAFGLLAIHWAWSGIVYQWFYFFSINPAARYFGWLFVMQAGVFAWLAFASRIDVVLARGPRGAAAGALIVYSLIYPGVGLVLGLDYPRMPVFAVPCPTTLLTAGFLLAASKPVRASSIVPMLWAGIGFSAAFVLGVRADLALGVAGALLVVDVVAPSTLGARRTIGGSLRSPLSGERDG
jgi:hypothetical protein